MPKRARSDHNAGVKRSASVTIAVPAPQLYEVVADLATYPAWLELVETAAPTNAPGEDHAWLVTLRAAVGPFARSKQLRMVRTVADGTSVRFERQELDDRDHANWVMSATVGSTNADHQSTATIELTYEGRLWTGPLDAVLDREIEKALSQLPVYLQRSAS